MCRYISTPGVVVKLFFSFVFLENVFYSKHMGEGEIIDEKDTKSSVAEGSLHNISDEDKLISSDFDINTKKKDHIKARTEKPTSYPSRFPVSEETTWENVDKLTYKPVEFTAQVVLDNDKTIDPQNPKLWADPLDPQKVDHLYESYEGSMRFDEKGKPLNPMGPTGIEGRGLLGKWGANNAADPIVTRIDESGRLQMIAIKRGDTGERAIPGGMVDRGERITATLKRELGEETSADLDFDSATVVFRGYVDDPRNTDNAWMETDAYHLHLETTDFELSAGDDATDAQWVTVDKALLDSLYASHADLVKRAIFQWQKKTGKIITKEGIIKTN